MKDWQQEVRESLYLHKPLPLHREQEYEARFAHKKVLRSRTLDMAPSAEGATLTQEQGVYTISAPLRGEPWPREDVGDVDYRNFGTARLSFPLPREDWTGYHRLRFSVKPDILGAGCAT